MKQKRASFTPEQKKEWDRAIVSHLADSPQFAEADTVLLYAPIGSEINLLPLVRIARERGKRVAFPRSDTQTKTITFYELLPNTRLYTGAYNIPEPPKDAPTATLTERTLCILPALTFSPSGARLGYGGGFYDRFLETFAGVCVGAVYEALLVRALPAEAHDRPVTHLFTERGMLTCKPDDSLENAAEPQVSNKPKRAARRSVGDTLLGVLHALKDHTTKKGELVPAEGEPPLPTAPALPKKALHAPPILVASTYLLLLLSRLIDTRLSNRDNEYFVVILLQLLIFFVPAVLYAKLRGDGFSPRLRFCPPRPEHLWFLFCLLTVMASGGLLCGILTGGISSLTGSFTLYDTFVARLGGGTAEVLYIILAYGLLPAFCEELLFRAFLCAEYERFGAGVAIAVSALFFAMLHFSFPHFLTYLFLGILLGCSLYTTRSFFAPFLLHLLYNLFCLFGRPYLSAFYVRAGSNEIFVFCLVTIFLLFSAFAVGEARKIYHVYARANRDSSYAPAVPWKSLPKLFLRAVLSPASAICLAIFLCMAILNLL